MILNIKLVGYGREGRACGEGGRGRRGKGWGVLGLDRDGMKSK